MHQVVGSVSQRPSACARSEHLRRSDLLVSLGRVGSEADGGKRAFDDIGRSQVPPVWFWKVEEGKHTIPVSIKGLDCLRERVLISCDELPAELPGIPKGVSVAAC